MSDRSPPAAPPTSSTPSTTATTATTPAPVAYPLVTVVVVAHNPGAWFDEVLASIVGQDYPALEVVVIDAASDIAAAPRVHAIIPEAVVIPLVANQGFAKNANYILDQPSTGPYLLVCHDDVALAPDCVRRLVEETLRSNAGVIGPKLLDWNDPNRILHVGLGADKTGLVSELAEPGEYDQEQHDAVRDVFAVPGAVTLMRADLFRALGGFDEEMVVRGEDLDLCWRAHALGARVMVNPEATARHREDLSTRVVGTDIDHFARRHRIRSMLSNYGLWHTLRVVPQALIAALINALIALLQGRVSVIFEIAGAWFWNLRRLPSVLRRRRDLGRVRQVGDAEVRAFQMRGFEGFNAWWRARADRHEPEPHDDAAPAPPTVGERSRNLQIAGLVWLVVLAVILFGSRDLISGGVPLFNQFTGFPDGPSGLLSEWASTWRSSGVGAEAPSSMLHVILGFAGVALFGQMGMVRLLVTVGMLVVGAVGAYRMLAPFRDLPAQLVALVIYVAVPLPYNALYSGSWSALVAYAAMPWIVRRMATAAGIAPFRNDDDTWWRRLHDVLALALILAAAGLVDPAIVTVPAVFALAWLVGSLATRRVRGAIGVIVVAALAMVLAWVLSLPLSLGLLSGDTVWSSLAGTERVGAHPIGLSSLMRMATGPHGDSALGWVILVVPALALVLASGPRLAWAARSWFVVIASLAAAVAVERDLIGVSMPPPVVLLAPAAISLALAGGMTAVAFGSDLRQYRFGWRQLVPFVAIGALLVSGITGLGGSLDGRWQVVDDGYDDVLTFLDERGPGHARALWLGDAQVLPVPGWSYDDELTYSVTQARTPTILDHSMGNPSTEVRELRDRFEASLAGAGNRLGRTLALYGVRYVVVVESNAPAPFGTIERPVDPALAGRLTEQLDLVRVEVRPGATIYENQAAVPTVAAFAPGTLQVADLADAPFDLALPVVRSMRSFQGSLTPSDLHVAVPFDTNWSLTIDGQAVPAMRSPQTGWSTGFLTTAAGQAELNHDDDTALWGASLMQLGAWLGLITVLILGRRRRT